MAAAVVYEGDVRRSERNSTQLFSGQKLWFSRSVPSRAWLMQSAERNGAQLVQIEQEADIKLVDHARKNQAPGTHSYRYVEFSIRSGRLEDLDAHRVGSISRVERPVGSVVTAGKDTRNRFTEADDQLLWNWIQPFVQAGGGWKGNEIYKQLESIDPRHTYQSWRDRWIKYTQYQKRQITAEIQPVEGEIHGDTDNVRTTYKRRKTNRHSQATPQKANIGVVQSRHDRDLISSVHEHNMGNAESSQHPINDTRLAQPASAQTGGDESENVAADVRLTEVTDIEAEHENSGSRIDETNTNEYERHDASEDDDGESSVSADSSRLPLAFNFTQSDARMLYKATCHILDARTDKLEQSWAGVAKEWGHTKDAWRKFFYDLIVPEYMKRHGIRSDQELEIHYKAKVREQRQQRRSGSNIPGHWPKGQRREGVMTFDQMAVDGSNESNAAEAAVITSRDDEVRNSAPVNAAAVVEHGDHNLHSEKHPDSTPFLLIHRPPKPNESRKLSQGKSSQTTSSQTKSQSSSQPPQRVRQLKDIPDITNTPRDDNASQLNQVQRDDPQQTHTSEVLQSSMNQPSVLPGQLSGINSEARGTSHPSVLRLSQDSIVSSSRFVTQISHGADTSSTDSDSDLEDIPYREIVPPLTRPSLKSDLLRQKEKERSRNSSSPGSRQDDSAESQASLPEVRIVDGESSDLEHGRSSEYVPSEAPSEDVHFESQVQLSQAWETAPEKATDEAMSYETGNDKDESASTMTQTQAQKSRTTNRDVLTDQDSRDDFETAPAEPVADKHSSWNRQSTEGTVVAHQAANMRLDTQALFQLPVQNDLAEIAAIPEPPEGWEDEEAATVAGMDRQVMTKDSIYQEADWTLPLPDIEADSSTAELRTPEQDDETDLENWLANQPKTYTSLPSMFISPLSHRALETASMDLDIASAVLARMVQRFEKGKHPAHRSLNEIRRMPKKTRKAAISELVEDLVPADMPGCWTKDDDNALLSDNGRAVQSVEDKHGKEAVRSRFEFLELWYAKS